MTMPGFMKVVIDRLMAAGLVSGDRLSGCIRADLNMIEAKWRVTLPVAYQAFLTEMGRSAGAFFGGTDYLFPGLLTLREQAERLLEECGAAETLDPADFVFAVHQGYQFLFFKCGASDDPAVFHYTEGDHSFARVANSFSEWLAGCATDEIELANELADS